MAVSELVAARIRELREGRAWSQEQLAEAAGLSRDAISRIERGDRAARLDTLAQLAEALGVHLPDLLKFDGEARRGLVPAVDQRLRSVERSFAAMPIWLAEGVAEAVRAIARKAERAAPVVELPQAAEEHGPYVAKKPGKRSARRTRR